MAAVFDVSPEGLVQTLTVPATSDYSACFWIYSDGTVPPSGEFRTLVTWIDDPGTFADYVWIGVAGVFGDVVVLDIPGASVVTANDLPLGSGWTFIAYVRSGNTHILYVDGAVAEVKTRDISAFAMNDQYLGTDALTNDWLPGKAAYFREWDVALTSTEISTEYLSETAVKTANLVTNTPLASDLLDDTANGHDWAESGGTITFNIQPDVTSETVGPAAATTTVVDTYSDHDMQCPGNWENGFKEGIVLRFGDGDRSLSDPWTGEVKGSTFTLLFSDHRQRFRQQLASTTDRYWIHPWTVKMTTRANRAVLGIPYTVFVGYVSEITFPQALQMEVTLADYISQQILNEQFPIPWRTIRHGMLAELDEIDEGLDQDAPEPIIYGENRRIPDVDPATPYGFEWTPILLGIRTVGAQQWYVWMIAGHAVADIPDATVTDADGLRTSIIGDEGTDWLIAHHAGYLAAFGHAYEDIRSSGYNNDRRYTLMYGKVGSADPDAVVEGTLTLTVQVDGVEPVGNGTGQVITDRFDQYKHFFINFVANRGPLSYQSGAWLTTPTHTVFDTEVATVDEDSFDAAKAIALERLPSPGSPIEPGYVGAAIIGASSSERLFAGQWIARWNVSVGGRSGFTHLGVFRLVMMHPTAAIKAAAPLYTDAYEVLKDSFRPMLDWSGKVNRIPYRADFEHRTGEWKTAGIFSWDDAIDKYGVEVLGEQREYPFAPGSTMADHLARMEVLQRQHPPRRIRLEATIGPDYNNQSAGYLDLGDYIRYRHFDAIASAGQIRLAQVEWHQVQAGKRRVAIEAIDCEDLIDFDAVPEDAPSAGSPVNDSCATAITIANATTVNYSISINTELHGEETSVEPPCVGSPAGVHHAAWWRFTPFFLMTGHVTTGTSDYDTVLSVWKGSCGSLEFVACNDNDGVFSTSFLEFTDSNPLLPGETYYFLVTGYGSPDFGNLVFTFFAEPA